MLTNVRENGRRHKAFFHVNSAILNREVLNDDDVHDDVCIYVTTRKVAPCVNNVYSQAFYGLSIIFRRKVSEGSSGLHHRQKGFN